MTEHKERIEHILHDLASEPVQAGDEFKQRLITTLRQEQRNILQARTDRRHKLSDSFSHWVYSWWSRPVVRWASVVVVLVLALVGIFSPWTSQHLWTARSHPLLTIHQGVAQVSSQHPSAPKSQGQGDVISIIEGTRITLDENSTASLSLFNGNTVELFSGTQLTLTKAQPRSIWQTQTVRMQMITGHVQVQVSPLRSSDERFEVDLPAALVSVRGTAFRAQVISPQHTYVATDEGVVAVTLHDPAQGNPLVQVPAGYQVDAIIGQPLQVRRQTTVDSEVGNALTPLPSPEESRLRNEITPSPTWPASDPVTATPASRPGTTVTTPSEVTTTVLTTAVSMTKTVIGGSAITATPPLPLSGVISPSHNSAPAISLSADLELVQIDAPNPTAAEGILTYMLIVANHGPGDAQDVVVRDILPPQVRLVDSTPPVIEEENGQTVTATVGWELGTLTVGDTRALQIVVTVHSWVTQPFTNTAIVTATTTDDHPRNNQTTVETALTDAVDLAISAEASTAIGSGSVVTCTLVYTNFGPAAAYNVTIMERLAAEMSFGGAVGAELRLPPPTTTMGTLLLQDQAPAIWMIPKLAAGTFGRIIFTATVQPGVLGPLTSTFVITSASPDNNWNDNDHDQVTFVTPVANVTIVQSVAPGPVVAGDALTYTLAYTNHGPWAAENVFITAMLPPSVTLTGQASSDLVTPTQTGQLLTWFIPSLLPGAGGTVVLTAIVDRRADGPLYSRAVIRSETLDDNLDDNTIVGSVDALMPALSLAQTVQPNVIAPHQPCTYTLYVTNTGAVTFTAQSLSLVEMLPLGFRPVTITATQPMTLAQTWAWLSPAPLAPGESFSVSLGVLAAETVSPGLYFSAAGATAAVPVRQAGGPITATAPVSVRLALPSIAMTQQITGDRPNIVASDRVTLTIHLINTGPSPLAAVPLLNHYDPQVLHFVDADPDPEETSGDGTVGWNNLIQAPHGTGRDILPGEALTATLAFDVVWPLTAFDFVESYVTIGKLRDVYGNLSDGYTVGGSVYGVYPLYLPMVAP